jgi:hypothetical protein
MPHLELSEDFAPPSMAARGKDKPGTLYIKPENSENTY